MKKQNKKLRTKIRIHIDKWKWIVTWLGWRFDIYYVEKHKDMPDDTSRDKGVNASVYSNWSYLKAQIYFSLEKCMDYDDKELEEIVLHELTHILLDPLDGSTDSEVLEYCVTSVQRVLSGLAANNNSGA